MASDNQLQFVKNVLIEKLWDHEHSWPFQQPVDAVALNIPDYYDVILYPIDLGTIKEKLEKEQYISAKEAIHDISLMLLNCIMYNNHKDDVVIMARNLLQILTTELQAMNETVTEKPLGKMVETVEQSTSLSFGHSADPENISALNGLDLLSAAAAEINTNERVFERIVSAKILIYIVYMVYMCSFLNKMSLFFFFQKL